MDNGYEPQEDDCTKEILDFWQEIEGEVVKAKDNDCMVVVEIDANAKVGKTVIKNDPHPISNNGKLLMDLIERQNLTLINAMDLCSGTITRERKVEDRTERSVIYYIVACEEMVSLLKEMTIDEDRDDVLTNYKKTKNAIKVIPSDHNIMVGKFNISYQRKPRTIRREIFHFKCLESKNKFKSETSSNNDLSSCFNQDNDFKLCANLFFRTLNRKLHKCFNKARIRTGGKQLLGDKVIQDKLKIKSELHIYIRNSKCKIGQQIATKRLEEIEEEIVRISAEKNADAVKEHIGNIETLDGKFCQLGLWKLKQKLYPPARAPPMQNVMKKEIL